MKDNPKLRTFNDGYITAYKLIDVSEPGGIPDMKYVETVKLNFEEQSIGYKRVYEAMQAGQSVDLLIECPRHPIIAVTDVVTVNGGYWDGEDQYSIDVLTNVKDSSPPTMRLQLSRVAQRHELAGDET